MDPHVGREVWVERACWAKDRGGQEVGLVQEVMEGAEREERRG